MNPLVINSIKTGLVSAGGALLTANPVGVAVLVVSAAVAYKIVTSHPKSFRYGEAKATFYPPS